MPVIDASVWVSFFLESDAFHSKARDLIRSLTQTPSEKIRIPTLALVEVPGTISRVTGSSILANDKTYFGSRQIRRRTVWRRSVPPNPHILMAPDMRRAAVQSLRIENTQAGLEDLFSYEND